jgi:hypothetical protein
MLRDEGMKSAPTAPEWFEDEDEKPDPNNEPTALAVGTRGKTKGPKGIPKGKSALKGKQGVSLKGKGNAGAATDTAAAADVAALDAAAAASGDGPPIGSLVEIYWPDDDAWCVLYLAPTCSPPYFHACAHPDFLRSNYERIMF